MSTIPTCRSAQSCGRTTAERKAGPNVRRSRRTAARGSRDPQALQRAGGARRRRLSVRANEAIGVVGPNGAGKTTLLSVLVGAHAPTAGSRLRGRRRDRATDRRALSSRTRAHAPDSAAFSGMTVFENVFTAARHGGGLNRDAAYARAAESLTTTGMIASPTAAPRRSDYRPQAPRTRPRAGDRPLGAAARRNRRRPDRRRGERTRRRDPRTQAARHRHRLDRAIVHILLRVAERLVCMDAGRIIADGAPEAVMTTRR